MKKFFHIGMRTTKTALCVFICLMMYSLFSFIDKNRLPDSRFFDMLHYAVFNGSPSFACIAAVISMQDSVKDTVVVGISRIIGSVVGGSFAIAFVYLNSITLSGNLFILYAVIGVIAIICLCNFFNQPVAVSISVITFLIIFIGYDTAHPYYFAFNRVTGTLIGAGTAFLVNRYISPPD